MDRAYTKEREFVETEEPAELQTDDVLASPEETPEIVIEDSDRRGAPVRIGSAAAPPGDNQPHTPGSPGYLQNAYGNIASLRLYHQRVGLGSRLQTDSSSDKYEREADQLAGFALNFGADRPSLSPHRPQVQRFPAGGGSESQGSTPEAVPANTSAAGAETAAPNPPAPGLIVEDSSPGSSSNQMTKSEFLSQLNANVYATVESSLAGTIWSAAGCPWIDHWFSYYQTRNAVQIEKAVRRFVPELKDISTAEDYIPLISSRVQQAIASWSHTGEIPGLPTDVSIPSPGSLGSRIVAGIASIRSGIATGIPNLASGLSRIFFKSRSGRSKSPVSPQAIRNQLNSGRPLDSGVKSRMEATLGVDFSQVRVHADTDASRLADGMNARAFTIGQDIAFGTGEYQPGTLAGEALIAHELAHVLQQGGGGASGLQQKNDTASTKLEEEADGTAVEAVAALWGGKTVRGSIRSRFGRLRSGLRLQRCGPAPDRLRSDDYAFLVGVEGTGNRWGFDADSVLQMLREADSETIRTIIDRLKLMPHAEYANRYHHLMVLLREDLDAAGWTELQRLIGAPEVSGETSVALSAQAESTVAAIRVFLQSYPRQAGISSVADILRMLRDANANDRRSILVTLRRTFDPTHGHELNALSARIRARGSERQHLQLVELMHAAGAAEALRESDPLINLRVAEEHQLAVEGERSGLSDEQMAALFKTRAIAIALTMLRNSEAQLLRVRSRSLGEGSGPDLDANVTEAVRILDQHFDPDVPEFIGFDAYATRVRSSLASHGHTIADTELRRLYNRNRQIALYRFGADRMLHLIGRISSLENQLDHARDRMRSLDLSLRGPVRYHLLGGYAPDLRIRQRWRREYGQYARQAQRLEGRLQEHRRVKNEIERPMPLLGGLREEGLQRLRDLAGGSVEFDAILTETLGRIFRNIEQARTDVVSGETVIWLLPPVIEATKREFGLLAEEANEAQQRWHRIIQARIRAAEADRDRIRDILEIINAGALLLALGTAIFTGGGSLAVYAGLAAEGAVLSSSLYGAVEASQQALAQEVLYGTGLTAETRLQDVPPDWDFVRQAWVNMGITAALSAVSLGIMYRSGQLSRLRGPDAAVREEVERMANQMRQQGATVSRRTFIDRMMTALRERGFIQATGGVRGRQVYELLDESVNPQLLPGAGNSLEREVQRRFVRPTSAHHTRHHGATLVEPTPGNFELHVPAATPGSAPTVVKVRFEMPTRLATSPHPYRGGPARLRVRREAGGWEATVQVHPRLRSADLPLVAGHELDELADIARLNPTTEAALQAETRAGIFARGSTSTRVTAHDQAAARELIANRNAIAAVNGSDAAAQARRAALTQREARMMQEMGLVEQANMTTKLNILRGAGASDDLLLQVELTAYRGSSAFGRLRLSSLFRRWGSIWSERLVGHIRRARAVSPSQFTAGGINGGHLSGELRAFANAHPEYAVIEEAATAAANNTYRRYAQYRWRGGGTKPGPTDPRFPQPGQAAAGTYDAGWELAVSPAGGPLWKTTVDDIGAFLTEADSAFLRWRQQNPGAAYTPGNHSFGSIGPNPPAVSSGGDELAGYFTYHGGDRWELISVFPDGATF